MIYSSISFTFLGYEKTCLVAVAYKYIIGYFWVSSFFANVCVLGYREFIIFLLSLCPRQLYKTCFVNSFCFPCNNFQCLHYVRTRKKTNKKKHTFQSCLQRPSPWGFSCHRLQCLFIWYVTLNAELLRTNCKGALLWLAAPRDS